MKPIQPRDVPAFANVLDFAKWYIFAGMPTVLPENAEVFTTDDATASCLFRHGRFQFELYLIHATPVIPVHEHPGVSNVEVPLSAMRDPSCLEHRVQNRGESHGVGFKERAEHHGFILLSAQMWDEGLEVSTIGARWKGHTAGPKHEALIRRFNPGCLIYPGYADVTAKAKTLEIL
jgi:hypothetical protein